MKLEKIVKSILAAGLLWTSGCAIQNTAKIPRKGHYYEIGTRIHLTTPKIDLKLSEQARTIPIHEDDGGPSRGSVLTDPDITDPYRIGIGLFGGIGCKHVNLSTGVDFNYTYFGDGDYWNEDRKIQPLPSPYNSQAYSVTRMDDTFSVEPFVGLDLKIWYILLGAEYSWPYLGAEFEKGHHRYNQREIIIKDHDETYGEKFTLKAGITAEDTIAFYLWYSVESYNLDLSGESTDLEATSWGIGLKGSFE